MQEKLLELFDKSIAGLKIWQEENRKYQSRSRLIDLIGGVGEMKNIEMVKNHIKTLRLLVSAAAGLEKARQSNSQLIPRTGIRGGKATTLDARHTRAAEYYHQIEERAEKEVSALWWE